MISTSLSMELNVILLFIRSEESYWCETSMILPIPSRISDTNSILIDLLIRPQRGWLSIFSSERFSFRALQQHILLHMSLKCFLNSMKTNGSVILRMVSISPLSCTKKMTIWLRTFFHLRCSPSVSCSNKKSCKDWSLTKSYSAKI